MKISKYILFQIFGWGAFALFSIYIAYVTKELTINIFIGNILLGMLGLLLSHFYKLYIQKKMWILLEIETLVFKVFLAGILLSILFNTVYFTTLFLLKSHFVKNISLKEIWGSFMSVFFLFSMWNLLYYTWMYVENSKRKQIESIQMQTTLKDLELKTLRANLQPHFIFNSLNSIRALIDENPEQARDAITKISNLLRSTITKQNATDLLRNELNLVEDYLTLEKIRFDERLHFETKISEDCYNLEIPTMMLQTLIENAIKHGISLLEQGGLIQLVCEKENSFLQIKIINDTNSKQLQTQKENSLGFGLSSTQQRLKLLYGESSTFSFEIKQNKAYTNIKIPIT